jgi:hypothetical protein
MAPYPRDPVVYKTLIHYMYISSDIDLVIKFVIVLTVTDIPYVPSQSVLRNKGHELRDSTTHKLKPSPLIHTSGPSHHDT